MEIKEKTVKLINSKYKEGYPSKLKIHWDRRINQYVLCDSRLFSYTHYTLEEIDDMKRILTEFIKKEVN